MKRTLLYIVAFLALVSCQKDPDVILTTVEVSNEVVTPSYTDAIVQCNITSSNSRIDVSVLCSPSADMTNAQEVTMEKQGGHYEATLTGLQDETTYYVRYKVSNKLSSLMAKQTNEFKTLTPSIPEVRLLSITNVLDSSAVAEISLITDGGAEVSQYGICWSTDEMPTRDDAHSESPTLQLSYSLSSLLPNTKYYVRAYAINKKGIAYSEAKSLLTYALPCVETKAITNIQKTGCKLNGEVTFNGNDANYVTGFCWSTKSQPTLSDNCTTMAETDAIFSYNLTNLKTETTYYVRAFAKNKIGLVYGNEQTFTTQAADAPAGVVMVDLGLSVKWANMNVGATKVEEYGDYFAWGETSTKTTYNWSTYKYCQGSYTTITKYCTNSSYGTVDNKTTLEAADDAAYVNWGGNWRMPTHAEQQELINNCTITWTNDYNGTGVAGRIFTSKKTGYTDKSIFLPAAGFHLGTSLVDAGSYGRYWSSSLNEDDSGGAWYLYFYSDDVGTNSRSRSYGFSVRPVCQ